MTNKLFTSLLVAACVAVGVLFTTNTYGQAKTSTKTQVISLEALGLFQSGNIITINYEWKASPTNSWHVRGRFSDYSNYYTGFGFGAGYHWYIADNRALTGLNVAPVAEVWFYNSSELNTSSTVFGVGGEIAYKWIFDQFAVEPGVGVMIGFGGDDITYYTKTRVYAQCMLGYAF
jgi:hypothetical protein